MLHEVDRRRFLKISGMAAAAAAFPSRTMWAAAAKEQSPFEISLAEWSLHRTIREGKMDHLDFATRTRADFDIGAVEYVDQFFSDKAKDEKYLAEMKRRAEDADVKSLLIMVDTAGSLGAPDEKERAQSVENHFQWVEAAKYLGCHSIRVNARSAGTPDEQRKLAADGLRRLSEFAASHGLNVIVENHGGLSSNGEWLVSVMKEVNLPNCGTLPDFGNFRLGGGAEYDRYQGVAEMMPFAKAVSAKSHDFDAEGNETHTDYPRMMKIVTDAGYHGFVGIEYEGSSLPEADGVRATLKLLKKVRESLA